MTSTGTQIGTLNEGSLHAAVKDLVAEPGDRFEQPLDGFVIDIVRGDKLVEIQTGSFGAMGRKLDRLLDSYAVHLVHPIAVRSWLVRHGHRDRRSPKKGSVYSLFDELVSLPTILDHPALTIELILAEVEKIQVDDPDARRGRGGWRTVDRRLRTVIERRHFDTTADLATLIPADLPAEFTTADLARVASIPRRQAQAMAYCMRLSGLITDLDRRRDGVHYERSRPG